MLYTIFSDYNLLYSVVCDIDQWFPSWGLGAPERSQGVHTVLSMRTVGCEVTKMICAHYIIKLTKLSVGRESELKHIFTTARSGQTSNF